MTRGTERVIARERGGLHIRPAREADRTPLLSLLERTGMFTSPEIEVARELIDAWLYKPEQRDYFVLTAEADSGVAGYVCYGPTPATEGTFDLYWIAVDPDLQGRGIGRALLERAEKEVLAAGGRLLVIETSSVPLYAPTRAFYEARGYRVEARIRDFYRPGDDRLIFTRRLASSPGGPFRSGSGAIPE
ncbi:MAG: Acetyltransferase YpeA [Synergistetes bacterium ADurb.Bin520]|nr:MAG: Acetyltransferase YpeA [Synergistetes bacterium ADurb.Bin520]